MANHTSMAARGAPMHARTSSKKPRTASFSGVVGEILCTLGVLIILYVFWQLYWTTWMVQGQVDEALSDFHAQYSTTTTDTGVEPEHRTDDPPAVGEVAEGEIYAVLHVPQWNWMQIPVAEGTDSSVLDLGYAGHYVTTQQAGEIGNFALAGHRRTYGNNFRRVDILRAGDQMVVETKDAYLIYEVVDYEIVQPDASEVLYAVPYDASAQPTERLMTMTTCHPEYGNSERYIVYSKMVYWTDKAEGVPGILSDETEVGGEFTDDTDSAMGELSSATALDSSLSVSAASTSSLSSLSSSSSLSVSAVSVDSALSLGVRRKSSDSGLQGLFEVVLEA